jgi:hypothetical protein
MASQLNIKDAETIALARDVARRRGTSVTAAVRDALRTAEKQLAPESARKLTVEQQKIFDTAMDIVNRQPKRPSVPWTEIEAMFDEINAFAYDDEPSRG